MLYHLFIPYKNQSVKMSICVCVLDYFLDGHSDFLESALVA